MTKSDLIFCLDLPSMRLQSWGVSYLVSMLHSDTQQLTDLMTADHQDWDHSWLRSTGRGRQIIISSSNTRDVIVISWSKYFLCIPYVWYYYDLNVTLILSIEMRGNFLNSWMGSWYCCWHSLIWSEPQYWPPLVQSDDATPSPDHETDSLRLYFIRS